MAEKKDVVETFWGKHHKYEVVREAGGVFSSPKYRIYRDGDYYKGAYSSLADAVNAAKKEAG